MRLGSSADLNRGH
uniref:Uncharacterized protein n=1 Tax=Anguilla anguilla TaxID=7936 RepID=A0A0E9PVY8_ANGAN